MLIEFVKRIILKHSLMQITWSNFKITWHTDNLLLSHQNTSPWQYIVSKVIFRIANRIFPLIKKSKIVIIVTFGTILRAPDHQEPLHQFFHLSSHVDLNMVSGILRWYLVCVYMCVHACMCVRIQVIVLTLHFPWDKSNLLLAAVHASLRGPWVSRELSVSSSASL